MAKPEDDPYYQSLRNQEELLYEQNYNQTTSLLAQEAIHRQQEEGNRLQAEQNEQLKKLTAQNADLQRRLNEQNANLQRQIEQQRQQMLDQQRQMIDRERQWRYQTWRRSADGEAYETTWLPQASHVLARIETYTGQMGRAVDWDRDTISLAYNDEHSLPKKPAPPQIPEEPRFVRPFRPKPEKGTLLWWLHRINDPFIPFLIVAAFMVCLIVHDLYIGAGVFRTVAGWTFGAILYGGIIQAISSAIMGHLDRRAAIAFSIKMDKRKKEWENTVHAEWENTRRRIEEKYHSECNEYARLKQEWTDGLNAQLAVLPDAYSWSVENPRRIYAMLSDVIARIQDTLPAARDLPAVHMPELANPAMLSETAVESRATLERIRSGGYESLADEAYKRLIFS